MQPKVDYHMHTPLCGHATGTPEEYAQEAIQKGLDEIGFSDHAPFVHKRDPGVTMGIEELPTYYKMIEDVRTKYKNDLIIKVAIEADFIPGMEDKTKAILDDYPYDYVLGSVHFIKNWEFDNPDERAKWDASDVNQVYRDYFELLRQSAQSGLFDIIAHADLVKKFGARPTEDMTDEVKKCAAVFKETGIALEINTSGWRKPCKEQYPQFNHLKIYAAADIPLTFGSDAHTPHDVGADFKEAYKLALDAGYTEYVIFTQRQIERRISL